MEQGYQLLQNPSVSTAIAKRVKRLADKAEITATDALKLIVAQARADARELSEHVIDACRYCWGEDNKYQRTVMEMQRDRETFEDTVNRLLESGDPKDKARAVRMGDFDLKGGIGFDPRKGPNPECGECFGRGVPKTIFKDTRFISEEAAILYAGTATTKDGTKILTHPADSARGMLAKHFGLLLDRMEVSFDLSNLSVEELQQLAVLQSKITPKS